MSSIPFDFSKPLHPRTVDFFLPLIPGLFFEVSVYWGKPELMNVFTHHPVSNTGYYTRIALALFCAYFVGAAALTILGFLLYLMKTSVGIALRASRSIKEKIYRYTGRRMNNPRSFARRFISPIQGRRIRRDMAAESRANNAYQVWAHAAERLLAARYGISPPDPMALRRNQEMGVWHEVLGAPTAEEVRGNSLIKAMYCSGCLGLVAIQIAPALWNRYYLGLSAALVVQGLFNDIWLAISWNNRAYDIVMRARSVLREIPAVKTEADRADAPDEELPG